MATVDAKVSGGDPKRQEVVSLLPMLEDELFAPPKLIRPYAVLIHLYALTEEGRPRHFQIPAHNMRWANTKLRMECADHIRPLISASPAILAKGLEVVGYKLDEETGELLINILSTRHEAALLSHGLPLAIFHFTSLLVVSLNA